MDLKATLSNTQQQAATDGLAQQQDQSQTLQNLRQHIKKIRLEKNELSAQFKQSANDTARLDELRTAMKQISSELKALEAQRKSLEALAQSSQSVKKKTPDFPPRFCLPLAIGSADSVARITEMTGEDAPEWNAYVEKNPRASLYHHYGWRRIIEESFGHACHYYGARNAEGNLCGILPMVNINSRLFGNYGVSLPFFNYGGPLADNQSIMMELMKVANEGSHQGTWQHLEYRSCQAGLKLPYDSRKVSMIRRLPKDQDSLERSLGSKLRAQYKQGSQHDPVLKVGGMELLDDFYQVFARAMRDLGTPVYGRSFFAAILRHMAQRATIICVYLDRRPAAAALLLGYRDMLEIPWAASLRDHNRYNVNMWMYRQILSFAVDAGYSWFDFGRSTMDSGTYRFKKQWGAMPLQHYWYYQFPHSSPGPGSDEQALPGLNPDNPKYRLAIAAWKRLPLFMANSLGPHIVKNLP